MPHFATYGKKNNPKEPLVFVEPIFTQSIGKSNLLNVYLGENISLDNRLLVHVVEHGQQEGEPDFEKIFELVFDMKTLATYTKGGCSFPDTNFVANHVN
jgi:hypothetical protein